MQKQFKNVTIFLLLVLMVVSLYMISADTQPQARELSYMGEFRPMVTQGQIASVEVRPQGNDTTVYTGKLKNGTEFYTQGPTDDTISAFLEENGVTNVVYNGVPEPSFWSQLLLSLLPILLIGAFLFFMFNQGQGGGKVMQFGKSRARLYLDEKKRTTFKDVAGIDEVIEELAEVVDFLKTPKKYNQLGARIPKGVLLYGSPGTGKTLLAKATAGEAGVPFFTISGSDFVEMFVGVGASRVRDLFDTAKKHAPCIIFIDEIDAVGRQRGSGVGGGHDEREQTLNQLLVEMDGFSANEGIIVMAGTNRPDILDPALLRPGRFDRQIAVGAPDIKGREAILHVHAHGKQIADNVDLSVIAKRTPGFTGADLANLLNEAALLAARRNKVKVEMEEVEEAVERVIAGPEKKSRVINPREKKLVSYHEAGHAVSNYYLENTDPVHKVSIIPRGGAGGYTLMLPKEDINYQTKTRMLEQVVVMLGGRMAEKLVLGDISTGASNDLERATDIVRQMITRYGMSERLGSLTFETDRNHIFLGRSLGAERNYSEETACEIDKEAKRLMDECYQRCQDILNTHMDNLHLVAQVLMEKETIDADEFYRLMEGKTEDAQPELNADDDNNSNGGEGAGSTEASLLEAIENVRNALGVDDNLGRPFA